ncbi:hypothetical protein [Pseudomonas phage vB_Pa-PAC2]
MDFVDSNRFYLTKIRYSGLPDNKNYSHLHLLANN